MPGYTPYLIADFKVGLELSREPWLLPADAFTEIDNGFLYQGVLQKRTGYVEFARVVHAAVDEVIDSTANGIKTSFSGTTTNSGIRTDDFEITASCSGITEVISIASGTSMSGVYGSTGTINYTTGAWTADFSTCVSGTVLSGTDITATYDWYPGNPVMGMFNYATNQGVEQLLVADTERLNRYDESSDELVDVTYSGVWTGLVNSAFVHSCNFNDHMYMTNNIDRVKDWDGSTLTNLDTVLVASGINEVQTALLVFPYKERLILFRTYESSDGACMQRARWCKAGLVSDWTNDGWVDAPTEQWITGGMFLGDDLIIFFEKSIWKLQYTSSATLPFKWIKVTDTGGCFAPFSVAGYSTELTALSATNLIGCDGRSSYNIDEKIPDIVLDFNAEKVDYAYAGRLDDMRQTWLTYPSLGSDYADKVLVVNYNDKSWSTYTMPMHCLGFYKEVNDLLWGDVYEAWDEIEWAWDDKERQAGFPVTLGGSIDGYIYKLNYGGTDNGSDISFNLKTARLNPFVKEAKQCRLGYIDFLVETDPLISLDVEFFRDFDETSYLTQTLTFAAVNDELKAWKRVYCNNIANAHTIKLSHTASNQTVKIHAMIIWVKPVGGVK